MGLPGVQLCILTILHSEQSKVHKVLAYGVLAILSAIGLRNRPFKRYLEKLSLFKIQYSVVLYRF